MAKYEIAISATAEKQLGKLPRQAQIRLTTAMLSLAEHPFPSGCRKLAGYDDVFRIRVGSFRVLYSVESNRLVIIILKVGDRKDIYRR